MACQLVARDSDDYISLVAPGEQDSQSAKCTCGLDLLALQEEKAAKDFVNTFVDSYFRGQAPPKRKGIMTAEQKALKRAFIRGAETGDAKVVQDYCDATTPNDIAVTSIDGWTALHHAARKGHAHIIQILLTSFQPLDIDIKTRNAWTALMMAADRGHQDAVSMLLEYGADPHLVNNDAKSSIFLARESKHWDIAQILTKHSSKKGQARNRDEEGAIEQELLKVCEAGDMKGLEHLISLAVGEDAVLNMKAVGCDNWTALHFAARKGHVNVVRRLLPFFEGSADIPTKTNWTPLMMAADKGHLEVVRLLLAGGASPLAKSSTGLTPIQLAREGNFIAVLGLFQHSLNESGQSDVKVLEHGQATSAE